MKILVLGLPGSGKTTLAKLLYLHLKCPWFNADLIREQFNDWDFSKEGRLRQAERMSLLAKSSIESGHKYVICDFVAPTEEIRTIYNADYTIWMDTIPKGRFDDTNRVFVPPEHYDIRVTEQNAEFWVNFIVQDLLLK